MVAYAYLSVPLTDFHAAFGRAVAAGHYVSEAVGFVKEDFFTGPVDDSIGGRCFGEAVGLFVGECWGHSRQDEED